MKQSWALRGRNLARDNQVEGRAAGTRGPWQFRGRFVAGSAALNQQK